MKQSFSAGLLACFVAVVLWGAQLPIAKDTFSLLDPFTTTVIRYAVATLLLVPVLVVREGWAALRYDNRLVLVSALGIFGMSASPLLVFVGMSWSRAEHAVVIVALQPSLTALLQWLLYGTKPARFTLGCIGLALLGVVLVVTKGQLTFGQGDAELAGSALVLLGGLCWVVYTLGTPRLEGWSAWRITVLTMIPGGLTSLLITALLMGNGLLSLPDPHAIWSVRWELSYLSIGGVLVGMLAWNFGIRRVGPLNATLFINFMPVMTFAFRGFQGYRFAPIELLGAGLVVTALVANNFFLRAQYLRRLAVPIA